MGTAIQNLKKKVHRAKLQELEESVIQGLKVVFEKWQKAKNDGVVSSDLIELLLRKSVVSSQFVMIQYLIPLEHEESKLMEFFDQESEILKKQLDMVNTTIQNFNNGIIG